MFKLRLYTVLIIASILGCVDSNDHKLKNINTSEKSDTLSLYLKDWQNDSLGCLNYRDIDKSKYIIKKVSLGDKKIDDVLHYLGKPNSIAQDSNSTSIIYYIGTVCYKNKIIDSTDFCWVQFEFNKKGFTQNINHTCL